MSDANIRLTGISDRNLAMMLEEASVLDSTGKLPEFSKIGVLAESIETTAHIRADIALPKVVATLRKTASERWLEAGRPQPRKSVVGRVFGAGRTIISPAVGSDKKPGVWWKERPGQTL